MIKPNGAWLQSACVTLVLGVGSQQQILAQNLGGQNLGGQNGGQNSGQNGGQNPGVGLGIPGARNPVGMPQGGAGALPGGGASQGGTDGSFDEFDSIWSVPTMPATAGFPTFPARLPGYGNYPLPVNPATGATPVSADTPFVLPLAPALPEPRGWPTWIRTQARKPLPFDVQLGLLVSQEGRVWHRDVASDPFTPLFLHDKFASLPIGAEVETRAAASFEVLLHDSTRIQARGLTRMKVLALQDDSVELQFDDLTWLRLSASRRTNRFRLPDGSVIEFTPSPVPAGDLLGGGLFGGLFGGGLPGAGQANPLGGFPLTGFPVAVPPRSAVPPEAGEGGTVPPTAAAPTGIPMGLGSLFGLGMPRDLHRPPAVEIERVSEPGWYGGRATLSNQGGTEVIWRHAFGETRIPPDHRVTLFLSRPTAPTSRDLQPGDARLDHQGARITARTETATEVQWCGAKIQLPEGGKITLESLGGDFGLADGPDATIANPRAAVGDGGGVEPAATSRKAPTADGQ